MKMLSLTKIVTGIKVAEKPERTKTKYKKEEELANPFFKEAAVLLRADINASLPNWGSEQKQQHLCLFI